MHVIEYYSTIKRNEILVYCYNIDEPGNILNEINQARKDNSMIPLAQVGRFIDTEGGIQITKGLGKGEWEVFFNGNRISIWND
jgi:hypothetical protein